MSRALVAAMTIAFCAPVALAVTLAARADRVPDELDAVPVPSQGSVRAFDGNTSQRKHIAFRLSADGRTIEGLEVTYVASCEKTLSMELADRLFAPIAVHADGTFSQRLGDRVTITRTTPTLRWTARV